MSSAVDHPAALVPADRGLVEQEHLRFAPQILARLGEELNPNPDQGVLELVRNAYDADATRCLVMLEDVALEGGTITIRDWGDGISRDGVSNGWLVLGRSAKNVTMRTGAGRLQVGQKGLGRLAALRQGTVAELRTWPRSRKGAKTGRIEHEVILEWTLFDRAETVDDVPVDVLTREVDPTDCGTEIVIRNLRRRWTRPEVKRLARALLLLSDPFGGVENTFKIEFVCPEHRDLESLVAGSYFDYSHYSIRAKLNSQGEASLRLRDSRLGIDDEVGHIEVAGADPARNGAPYETLPAEFELHGFLRSNEALHGMGTAASLAGLRDWLDAYGGVHIYHRGLRVAPYGDPGFDWLDMNLLRARNPEQRPSTNNAVGRMIVEDSAGQLVQKTDRSGFIEDERFLELRNFGRDVLEWVGRRRTKVADEQRENEKRQGPKKRERAREKLDKELERLPSGQRKAISSAVRKFERATEHDAEQLRKDLLLYRTLATIGTTSAQIAHETYNPALAIIDLAREIEELVADELEDGDWAALEPPVTQIDALAQRLRDYARLPRVLLAEPKRRMRVFPADGAVADTVAIFEPLMRRHQVTVEDELRSDGSRLRGPSALLDAILANLLINAVHALDSQANDERRLLIRTSSDDRAYILEVADNGPGIEDLDIDEVWVPGATTTPDGTGLGLTIVRDSAMQLGGSVSVDAHGEMGGAHFYIRLPMAT
jgi:signal transduction histidine kinase